MNLSQALSDKAPARSSNPAVSAKYPYESLSKIGHVHNITCGFLAINENIDR